jgi:hypothetical protein
MSEQPRFIPAAEWVRKWRESQAAESEESE